ncbi:MAG: hypothetical protein ACK5L6_10245 [Anaerorhabdus sp.]|uniref:hypothetical protein n=1 Tax=Anaerorhabdus sp. TaxID=1872524 RepID=UPI003A89D28B
MAKTTENYALIKPDYGDAADIAVINSNMDIIDGELKNQAEAINTKAPADHNHDDQYYTEMEIDSKVISYQARYFFDVTADTSNWQSGSTVVPNFPYTKNIALAEVTPNDVCIMSLSDVSDELGILAIQNDSYAGGVTIYAREIPSVALKFNVIRVEKVKVD